ncbi:MAG: hypothetical protein ACREQI_13685 [Candidatus Binataceae bacterium]
MKSPAECTRGQEFSDPSGLLAFTMYFGLSFLIFGLPLLGHFDDFVRVPGADPSLFMWNLVWWPYALIHRLNPFYTRFIWAPIGINLT